MEDGLKESWIKMQTTEQASKKLALSSRQIRMMAAAGRIPGAQQLGGVWLLPDDFSIIEVRRGRPPFAEKKVSSVQP